MEADLEAALALITKLRSERDDALQQSEESRQRQLELEETNAALQGELQSSLEIRRALQELRDQQAQELKAGEHLLLQLRRDLEGQEPERQALREEANRFREAYYEARGEAERLKAELDTLTNEAALREERAKQQYDDIQRQLNDKIQQLQGDSAGDSDAEELRRLRQKAHQLETQLATAQAELEAALREKIDAVAASQHAQQQANRTQADYEGASAAYEAERQGHLAQLSQLKAEIEECQAENSRLREELTKAEQNKTDVTTALENKVREQQQAINAMHVAHAQHGKDALAVQAELHVQLEQAQTRQSAAEAALEAVKATLQRVTEEHCNELQAAREQQYARLRDAEERTATLEEQLVSLRGSSDHAASMFDEERQQLNNQLLQAAADLEAERREGVCLRDEVAALKSEIGRLEQTMESMRDPSNELSRLSQGHDGLRELYEQAVREAERLSAALAQTEHDKKELDKKYAPLEASYNQLRDLAEKYKTKSREQRRQLEERVAQLQPALDAANQDMERWKARCTSLESRVKQFGQALQGDGAGSHVPAPTPSSYRAQPTPERGTVYRGDVQSRLEARFPPAVPVGSD